MINLNGRIAYCPICGRALNLAKPNGADCIDPAHWLAAGVVAADDYYAIAQLEGLAEQAGDGHNTRTGVAPGRLPLIRV
jgi:hypothetical protein